MPFLIDGLPAASGQVRRLARSRLWRCIEAERRRRVARRRRARTVVAITVVLLVLGVAPRGPDGDLAPLLGLADAVAASPPPIEPVARHWYSRSESTQLVTIPIVDTPGSSIRFLVTAVEEIWHDGSEQPQRRISYGNPTFLSPEDERIFHSNGLDAMYPEGFVEALTLPLDQYAFADDLAVRAPDQLASALRRKVSGVGDQRLEEVRLLRLTAHLMQLHAEDPVFRAAMLRVIADIPGITVTATSSTIRVSFDYVDGDRPLRLEYDFDAETAHLVRDSLAVLATRTEPGSILRTTTHSLVTPDGAAGS